MITGYMINKETGKVESYYELKEQPKNTEKYEFRKCEKDKFPVIEKEPTEPVETTEQLIERKINELVKTESLRVAK